MHLEATFDLDSVSQGVREPRGAGVEICSVGVPSVCAGEVVDIEVDSGAEVSCLSASIGADTYPLHETTLSMCGGHHVAAGGGKPYEQGARILGLEAGDVRGEAVNLLVRVGSWKLVKRFCRHKILAAVAWETVFPADCGDAYLVKKASGISVTLVRKRCAWYLRVKLKPHSELPYAEDTEFMEVMSLDRAAGVRPVQEGR